MTGVRVRLRDDLGLRLIGDFANKIAPDTDARLDATFNDRPIDLSNHPGFKLFSDPSRGPTVACKQNRSGDWTVKTMWNAQVDSGSWLLPVCQEIAEHFDQRRYARGRLNEDPWRFVDYQTFLALVEDLGDSAWKTKPALILRRHHLFFNQEPLHVTNDASFGPRHSHVDRAFSGLINVCLSRLWGNHSFPLTLLLYAANAGKRWA